MNIHKKKILQLGKFLRTHNFMDTSGPIPVRSRPHPLEVGQIKNVFRFWEVKTLNTSPWALHLFSCCSVLISAIPLLHFPKPYFSFWILRQNLLAFHASLGITTISNWQSLVSWSRFLDFRGDQRFFICRNSKVPTLSPLCPRHWIDVQRSLTHTFRLVSGGWFLSQGLGRCRLWYKPVPGDLEMPWSNFHQMLSLSDRIVPHVQLVRKPSVQILQHISNNIYIHILFDNTISDTGPHICTAKPWLQVLAPKEKQHIKLVNWCLLKWFKHV